MLKNKEIFKLLLFSAVLAIILAVVSYIILTGASLRTWHSYLFNFLFVVSLSAGLAVMPSILLVSNSKWVGSYEKICWSGISFSVPSIVVLIILWIGSKNWAPWINSEEHKIWMQNNFVFMRNLVLLSLFWFFAFLFYKFRYHEKKIVLAGWLIFIFAVSFSIIGFDFVMGLDPKWHSMMTGGYFFISALYLASATWALITVLFAKQNPDVLYDIGRLIITFCMITSYLMFSQLLPIWYENLPDETRFLIPRLNLAWKPVSYVLLAIIYLGPLFLLLPAQAKKNRFYMATISIMIITGMWIERWWAIAAIFEPDKILFGWNEIIPFLVFLVILISGIFLSVKYIPDFKWITEYKERIAE